tara:strand:+ start:1002 stop:1976 length:975 start_codon:yes stop_codon:yes gene_type:complete
MKNIFEIILIKIPQFEVLIRNLYWRFSILNKIIYLLNKRKKIINKTIYNKCNQDNFFDIFYKNFISDQDIILLHSSLSNLSHIGLDQNNFTKEIIQKIKNENITLVTPTFPIFKNNPKGLKRFNKPSLDPQKYTFDYRSTRISTGFIGREFIKNKNVLRSKLPLNNLSAIGPLSNELFKEEKFYYKSPYPCGKYSPWHQLYKLDALIVFFDINPAHSCTFIHYLEDINPSVWPIKNWYRERNFTIKIGDNRETLFTYERDPKWSMSYCEHALLNDLISEKIINYVSINGIKVFSCKALKFIEYFVSKNKYNGYYPYFCPYISRL